MNVEPWSTISTGETGRRARAIQYLLRAHGQGLAPDGVYGPVTAAAVSSFQASRGQAATGMVTPETWPALVIVTSLGDSGDAVRGLQSLGLMFMPDMPELSVDGAYGPLTRGRVREYQEVWGLTQDGIAGRETWSFGTADGFPWPLVKVGQSTATNRRVPIVQHLLRHRGATIVADGSYGPLTGEAVRQFQLGLRAQYVSTTVGQLDWPELIIEVRPGEVGEHVKAVQSALPGLTVDGVYGPLTRAQVDIAQEIFGGADGVVEEQTWRVLIGPVFE
ncbi:MAG: peptidoglycan-binding domain-containing protein [Propioniciclava sp.]